MTRNILTLTKLSKGEEYVLAVQDLFFKWQPKMVAFCITTKNSCFCVVSRDGKIYAFPTYAYVLGLGYNTELFEAAGPKRHVALLGGRIWGVSGISTKEQIDAAIRWTETGFNDKATEDFKTTTQNTIKLALENNQLVGIKGIGGGACLHPGAIRRTGRMISAVRLHFTISISRLQKRMRWIQMYMCPRHF